MQPLTTQTEMHFLYELQQASVPRTKTPFSVVFIQHTSTSVRDEATYEALYTFVASHCRNTDRVYRHESLRYVIAILPFSGTHEAQAFFERLIKGWSIIMSNETNGLLATINEIANSRYSLDDVIQYNTEFLRQLPLQPTNIAYSIDRFAAKIRETIRVSILENDDIALSIIENSIQNVEIQHFDLQLQTFHDGNSFIESDWHLSGHTHIVITNDILPFKNGLEIVTYLRSLPNDEKYIILLISKRSTEDAMIYAYNSGVDAYYTRPFNIRLLEAQMKNILNRLR